MEHYTLPDLRWEIEHQRGEPLTDDGFNILLSGFKAFAARRGLYTRQAIEKAVDRGWLSEQMAYFFKRYALE